MTHLRITEQQLNAAAQTRSDGFIAAVKSIAPFDDGICEISIAEWYALSRKFPRPSFGLGDAVHSIANPIAKAIDAVAGTNIQGCGGCAERRDALNRIIPNL